MATSASSAARTLADVLTGRAEVAYAVHGGMVTLESPAWPGVEVTGNDAYELQRRLGHQSQRYINRYTNPPEDIAAGYVEGL